MMSNIMISVRFMVFLTFLLNYLLDISTVTVTVTINVKPAVGVPVRSTRNEFGVLLFAHTVLSN